MVDALWAVSCRGESSNFPSALTLSIFICPRYCWCFWRSDVWHYLDFLSNCLLVCVVSHQAAIGPWISGNMVYCWWSPPVGLPRQLCESVEQSDDWMISALLCLIVEFNVSVFQGHCFYHGEVLGREGSSVAVSTCSGLRYVKQPTDCIHKLFSSLELVPTISDISEPKILP